MKARDAAQHPTVHRTASSNIAGQLIPAPKRLRQVDLSSKPIKWDPVSKILKKYPKGLPSSSSTVPRLSNPMPAQLQTVRFNPELFCHHRRMLKLQEAKLLLRLTRAQILLAERENSHWGNLYWGSNQKGKALCRNPYCRNFWDRGWYEKVPNKVKQAQLVPFIVMLNSVWEPGSPRVCLSVWFKGSFVLLVSFFFASNRFFQEPVPEEDKNRNPQWSETEETRLKTHQTQATPNTHPI